MNQHTAQPADSITEIPAHATSPPAGKIVEFIRRWEASGAAERANYALFLTQLCDLLGVPQPDPTTDDVEKNAYVFERDVTFQDDDGSTSIGRIDLYKRACFVLEAKQGSDAAADDPLSPGPQAGNHRVGAAAKRKKGTAVRGTPAWDDAMIAARGQADRYARALPSGEGWPPFLIVVDVGHVIELYSEFTRQGKTYVPFPDPQSFRIKLADLAEPAIRERLKLVWTDPLALDPSRKSAKVTRELASRLAELAKLLEKAGHDPARVARFLMRCLFTMFAEDVELIPKDAFKKLLTELEGNPAAFPPMIESLWQTMNAGGFSTILRQTVLRFNGGLFAEHEALPLTAAMLKLLRQASEAFWGDVEPAIFGTLLERALDPVERHKLGAHYTPRAYVERLVLPTIIEPLRDEWKTSYAAALTEARQGNVAKAQFRVREFHHKLCETMVLDPACGSGNFLYVTMEHMKRLEGEILIALEEFGDKQPLLAMAREVDPHQFLGIEINPRAAAIADLVLWIGYLQWHFRTRGKATPAEPIIKDYKNIQPRDAVLNYDGTEPLLDESGQPVTRWDGRTTKRHPVTGEEVPDETARVPVLKYINPRKAEWITAANPKIDYVVGNPPFSGKRGMREEFDDGYVDALRDAFKELPRNCDYVMYWWHQCASLAAIGAVRRFGLITTSKIREQFNSQIVNLHMISDPPVLLGYALPDHPWVDASDGADVRIAITVGDTRVREGVLERLTEARGGTSHADSMQYERTIGLIQPDLTIGPNILKCEKLSANLKLSAVGFQFNGTGFVISKRDLKSIAPNDSVALRDVVRPFMSTKDITGKARSALMIDLYGLEIDEVRAQFPGVYQWILERVKPERDVTTRKSRRERWWIFGEALAPFRPAMSGLARMIGTPITSKHRLFIFLDTGVGVDSTAVMIASDDAFLLGVLSSHAHEVWALRSGSKLGVGNDPRYNKTRCFERFPFPNSDDQVKVRIRELGEQLDGHRKRQQALHPWLTLTDMYNVLEKLRAADRVVARSPDRATPADRRSPGAAQAGDLRSEHRRGRETRAEQGGRETRAEQERRGRETRAEQGGRETRAEQERRVDAAAKREDDLALTDKERKIHEAGLVSVLKQIHDDLDAAVFAAYGWPATLSDEQILERLVALNAERAAEEARGIVRWLRPEFQCRQGPSVVRGTDDAPADDSQTAIDSRPPSSSAAGSASTPEGSAPGRGGKGSRGRRAARKGSGVNTGDAPGDGQSSGGIDSRPRKQPWPAEQAARTRAVQKALAAAGEATSAADLARRFQRARASTVEEILEALVSLGLAHRQRRGKYQA